MTTDQAPTTPPDQVANHTPMPVTVGAGGKALLEAQQQVWRGEAEGGFFTALFAGKQMWVAESEDPRTFQLTYLDFKSDPLPSLEAAQAAAPAFARAVLDHMQSLVRDTESNDREPTTPPTVPSQQSTSAAQPAVTADRQTTSVFGFEAGADPYTQAIFGIHAQHVPAWLYVQHQGNGMVSFVGASRSNRLVWGGTKEHQFMLGELIARPHFVIESNRFVGHGLAGLATADHLEFVEAADRVVLCDPLGIIAAKSYNQRLHWQ